MKNPLWLLTNCVTYTNSLGRVNLEVFTRLDKILTLFKAVKHLKVIFFLWHEGKHFVSIITNNTLYDLQLNEKYLEKVQRLAYFKVAEPSSPWFWNNCEACVLTYGTTRHYWRWMDIDGNTDFLFKKKRKNTTFCTVNNISLK